MHWWTPDLRRIYCYIHLGWKMIFHYWSIIGERVKTWIFTSTGVQILELLLRKWFVISVKTERWVIFWHPVRNDIDTVYTAHLRQWNSKLLAAIGTFYAEAQRLRNWQRSYKIVYIFKSSSKSNVCIKCVYLMLFIFSIFLLFIVEPINLTEPQKYLKQRKQLLLMRFLFLFFFNSNSKEQ